MRPRAYILSYATAYLYTVMISMRTTAWLAKASLQTSPVKEQYVLGRGAGYRAPLEYGYKT